MALLGAIEKASRPPWSPLVHEAQQDSLWPSKIGTGCVMEEGLGMTGAAGNSRGRETMNDRNIAIAVAPNGGRKTKADHPALPLTPAELAATAAECLEAGAAMIHVHVRDANGRHLLDADAYRAGPPPSAKRSATGPSSRSPAKRSASTGPKSRCG